jgi:hypothetical protein
MVSFPDELEDPESNIPIRSVAINIIEQAQCNQELQDGAFDPKQFTDEIMLDKIMYHYSKNTTRNVMTRITRKKNNICCLEKHLPLQNLFSRCVII